MSFEKQHLRHCLLFAFQLKKSAAEAKEMICSALGENAVSYSTCKKWFQNFRDGKFNLQDKERPGQPKKVDDKELEQLLDENPCWTQEELAEELCMTQPAISVRLHKLGRIQKSVALQKELAKTKKILHPNSRKAVAIAKKTKKISNRQKTKMMGAVKQNLVGEKMMWIQQHMVPDICPYTPELTAELLLKYIGRNDEELEQITIKHSIGGRRNRQHASREDIIRMTKQREQEEFDTCGIEIPDILTPTQCEMLRKWSGELRLLPNFKFRRFGKKHLKDALQRVEKQTKKSTNNKTVVTSADEKIEDTE